MPTGDPGRDSVVSTRPCLNCKVGTATLGNDLCWDCRGPTVPPPLKDGGDRTAFATGSQRDTQDGKPRPDLLPVRAQLRKSVIHMLGSIKYDERNWEKGQPQSQFLASLLRHLFAWMMGDTSEDHLAQAGWNLDALLDQEERYFEGLLPEDLMNIPAYGAYPAETLLKLPTRVFLGADRKAAAQAAQNFKAAVAAAKEPKQ